MKQIQPLELSLRGFKELVERNRYRYFVSPCDDEPRSLSVFEFYVCNGNGRLYSWSAMQEDEEHFYPLDWEDYYNTEEMEPINVRFLEVECSPLLMTREEREEIYALFKK